MASYTSTILNEDQRNEHSQRNVFLNMMRQNYQMNFQHAVQGRRYESDITKFSVYMRILSGKLLYNTFKANTQYAIPSDCAVRRYIHQHAANAPEGVLRINELLKYIDQHKLPKYIHISEDATKITSNILYNSKTNKLVGFVQPLCQKTGMPITEGYDALSARDIENCFYDKKGKHRKQAQYVTVVMASPVSNNGIPAFCLLLFGSDGSFDAEDVSRRWKYIVATLKEHDITVIGVSSDSDIRYNSVMRKNMKLGEKNPNFPEWFNCRSDLRDLRYVPDQDMVHIGTKIRNRILDHDLKFGQNVISISHILALLRSVPKPEHRLTENIVRTNDRQNFDSVLQICEIKIIKLIETNVKCSQGTVFYLKVLSSILRSYLDPTLSPLERIRHIWFSNFMLRIWRESILDNKNSTLKEHFVTLYAYVCVEINSHSLILLMLFFKEKNLDDMFSTETVGSQPCENIFRVIRSLSSTFSTVVNCSLLDIIHRMCKIELLNNISHIELKNFNFPRIGKQPRTCYPKIKRIKQNGQENKLPSSEEIFKEIELAKLEAIEYAETLGVFVKSPRYLTCNLNVASTLENTENTENTEHQYHQDIRNDFDDYVKTDLEELESKNVLKFFSNVNFSQYANKNIKPDGNPTECGLYVRIDSPVGKTVKALYIRKDTLCWFLRQSTERVSSDRLKRVMSKRLTE